MKKTLVALLAAFAMFEGVYALAATYQPNRLGWVNLSIASMTVTAINASTAPTVGYMLWCYNCVANGGAGTLCISTTTAAPGGGSDFVLSTGTVCK